MWRFSGAPAKETNESNGSRRVSKQQTSDATGTIVGTEAVYFSCASADSDAALQ